MNAPFFIVGASRSGTTLLRLMLNAHPRLGIPGELKYFTIVDPSVTRDSWRTRLSDEAYRRLIDTYLSHRAELFGADPAELKRRLQAHPDHTLRGPYQCLLDDWAARQDVARWGEKTPRNLFYVDVLADMFPEARFLHLVRDPRAVVQSMNAISYYSDETVFNALNWRKSIREGQHLLADHVPSHQTLTVRYEDLVVAPEDTLRRVCGFLDERFDPGMLRFYETADQCIHQTIQTPSIQSPVNQDSLTKWRRRLRGADVSTIEALCHQEMKTMGYERDTTDALLSPASLAKAAYWRWKVWRHQDQRGYEVGFSFLAGLRARLEWLWASPQLQTDS